MHGTKIIYKTIILLMLVVSTQLGKTFAAMEEERYMGKKINGDLMNLLASIQSLQPTVYEPYQYYGSNSIPQLILKRNSELINSLLSLPKSMNDAGK